MDHERTPRGRITTELYGSFVNDGSIDHEAPIELVEGRIAVVDMLPRRPR